jgi:hypothetical protein
LVREVSDSLHLRRFCLIAIDRRGPDKSTVRKLARRLGAEVVEEITRVVIEKAKRETRFRGRAARIDSTVVQADIRYPSDAILALAGARALAHEGRKLTERLKDKRLRRQGPLAFGGPGGSSDQQDAGTPHRGGQGAGDGLNEKAGRLIARSAREAARLAVAARASSRGRGAQAKLRTAAKLEELAGRAQKVAEQIDRRARGLKITDLSCRRDPAEEIIGDGGFLPSPTKEVFPELTNRSSYPAATSPALDTPANADPLPHRNRGPHQPPQTKLRAAPLPTQRT